MEPKKKRLLFMVLATLIVARVIIMFVESRKENIKEDSLQAPISVVGGAPEIHPDANVSKIPSEAITSHNNLYSQQNEICPSMRTRYQKLDEIKKNEKVSVRFVNIHKKVDGLVYRTRFFYKDSSENEIPTYLLYKEDDNDEPIIIENTPYKKGPQYLKIEAALGDILYTEEGVNVGADQDLFLHYENKTLKDLQGLSPLSEFSKDKKFIECRF